MTRREALKRMGVGFGMASLAAETSVAVAGKPHFAPRAKRVVFLFLNGGPSHVDTFDPKPELSRFDAKAVPDHLRKLSDEKSTLMGSPFHFSRYGRSGIEVSELFPKLGALIDECCVVRSMWTDNPVHELGMLRMNTGHLVGGHPSMGSWITYGLGTENQNLPGFVALCPGLPYLGTQLWASAYLPGIYQGVHVRNRDEMDPTKLIQYLQSNRYSQADQRRRLDLLGRLNRLSVNQEGADPQVEASIHSMELAFHMQSEALDAFDVRKESSAVRERYGEGFFARGCLMARRLVERGVRMVQVYFGNRNPWDSHPDIFDHRKLSQLSDGPIATLIQDLKASGLLEETIVIIGGEFGRTPTKENGFDFGRGHNNKGFSYVVAGGGFRKGLAYGATDELGFEAVENRVHVNDLHATILHQLGLDHTKLTFRYSGRDFRLTDVGGRVVRDLVVEG
jgi:hypothetical protein